MTKLNINIKVNEIEEIAPVIESVVVYHIK